MYWTRLYKGGRGYNTGAYSPICNRDQDFDPSNLCPWPLDHSKKQFLTAVQYSSWPVRKSTYWKTRFSIKWVGHAMVIAYICSAQISHLSGYISRCPFHNGVPHCVTGCPDAQLQIHNNRLPNRASLRLSHYVTRQDQGCPVAQPGNMKPSRFATGQVRGCPIAQLGNMKPSHYATGQERDCPISQPGNMWLSHYATGQHKAAPLSKRASPNWF